MPGDACVPADLMHVSRSLLNSTSLPVCKVIIFLPIKFGYFIQQHYQLSSYLTQQVKVLRASLLLPWFQQRAREREKLLIPGKREQTSGGSPWTRSPDYFLVLILSIHEGLAWLMVDGHSFRVFVPISVRRLIALCLLWLCPFLGKGERRQKKSLYVYVIKSSELHPLLVQQTSKMADLFH